MTTNTDQYLGVSSAELDASGAVWTAREIEQQPRMLKRTHTLLTKLHEQVAEFVNPVAQDPAARIILTGAGTSSYIGQCLAPLLDRQLAARVDAVSTTDIVSCPRLYLDADQPLLLISFGRSGNSPESVAAIELVETLVRDVRHLIVTCNPDGALGKVATRRAMTLQLPEETHDRSFAMTSSFSCMTYAMLLVLGAAAEMDTRIDAIARATERVIADANSVTRELALLGCDRVVYLGSGLMQGLAREAALKLGELSNGMVATCFESSLGFRHGPKTFVNDRTLVMVFTSNDATTRHYDHDLIDELRSDDIAARVIEISANPRAQALRDTICVPDMTGVDDIDLLWPFIAVAQLYAFHASRALGLAPDNPNQQGTVNRVVQGVRIHPLAT